MKRKSISIYSVVISCVFAAATVFFAANIFYEYAHGGARAGRTFSHLASSIKKDGSSVDFQKAAGSLDDYAALCLYRNGEAVFIYPDGSAEAAETTKAVAVYRTSIPVGGDVYSVTAALYVIRPSVVFRCARISFIVIMIATLLTAAVIVYVTAADGGASEVRAPDGGPAACGGGRSEVQADGAVPSSGGADSVRPDESEAASVQEARVAGQDGMEEAEEDADQLTWDFSGVAMEDDGAVPEDDGAEAAEIVPDDGDGGSALEERGLPEGEPVRQDSELAALPESEEVDAAPSPLEAHLSEALLHAEEAGGDVSLFMVSVSGVPADGGALNSVRGHLSGRFSEEGSVFEVGAARFAVVRSGLAIDGAEAAADSVQSELCGLAAGNGAKCCIGISSRSARSGLPASRLILEASEALRHAEEDSESSVVAFHVDIEKYREYVKSV